MSDLVNMTIKPDDYCKLNNRQREMLRMYSVSSGQDKNGDFWFTVANYRVAEIMSSNEISKV